MNRIRATVSVVLLVGVISSVGSILSGPPANVAPTSVSTVSGPEGGKAEEPTRQRITMGVFQSIGPPLRYEELKPLIGPGELTSQSYAGGFMTEGYRWKNDDGSWMGLVVQNGRVVSKQQVGLH